MFKFSLQKNYATVYHPLIGVAAALALLASSEEAIVIMIRNVPAI